jgi:hypothetical protein
MRAVGPCELSDPEWFEADAPLVGGLGEGGHGTEPPTTFLVDETNL